VVGSVGTDAQAPNSSVTTNHQQQNRSFIGSLQNRPGADLGPSAGLTRRLRESGGSTELASAEYPSDAHARQCAKAQA